ncbi:hypothetical protein ACOME3_003622 [Neoechinorhynchus agilis]
MAISSSQPPIDANAINDLKHLRPLWDDFLKRATKFNNHARLFLRSMSAFTDSLDAISQVASTCSSSTFAVDPVQGNGRSIGKTLQAVSSYQRSLEFKCRSLQTAFNDRLLHRLSDQEASKELDSQINGFFMCLRPVLQAQATMAPDFKRLSDLMASLDNSASVLPHPQFDANYSNRGGVDTWPSSHDASRSSFFSSNSSINNTVVDGHQTNGLSIDWSLKVGLKSKEPDDSGGIALIANDSHDGAGLNTSTCTAPKAGGEIIWYNSEPISPSIPETETFACCSTIWRRSSRYQRLAPKPVAVPRVPGLTNHSQSASTSTSISGITSTTVTDVLSTYGPMSCGGGSVTYDQIGSSRSYAMTSSNNGTGGYTDSVRSGPAALRRNITSSSHENFPR